jgi:hypothetical protein
MFFSFPVMEELAASAVLFGRFRCQRRMPSFPTHISGQPIEFVAGLENAYADVKLKCSKCPHRGMPLTGLPEKDGVVVCNGHGLAWNVQSGEMVRRLTAESNKE